MFMVGVTASKIGSSALAAILYNMDTFNVDVSNLRTIDNSGSEGVTADGLMYGSNHIYLGATQSVTYTTVDTGDYAYFDVTTKSHVKSTATAATTTISTPIHHSNFFSLKAGKSISSGDITAINANPEDIARMVKGVATVGTYSFTLADIEAFYPGNEGDSVSIGGNFVQEVTTTLGAENVTNSTLDSGILNWGPGYNTASPLVLSHNTDSIKAVDTDSIDWSFYGDLTVALSPSTMYRLEIDIKEITITSGKFTVIASSTKFGLLADGEYVINKASPTNMSKIVKFFTPTRSDLIYIVIWSDGGGAGTIDISQASIREATATEIINYTATSRTTYKNTNYGASNFLYTQDTTGRLTGMHTSGHIKSGKDGRNITIAMTTPYNHVVTKDIDKIEGSLTSCTITYSDTTTLVVP